MATAPRNIIPVANNSAKPIAQQQQQRPPREKDTRRRKERTSLDTLERSEARDTRTLQGSERKQRPHTSETLVPSHYYYSTSTCIRSTSSRHRSPPTSNSLFPSARAMGQILTSSNHRGEKRWTPSNNRKRKIESRRSVSSVSSSPMRKRLVRLQDRRHRYDNRFRNYPQQLNATAYHQPSIPAKSNTTREEPEEMGTETKCGTTEGPAMNTRNKCMTKTRIMPLVERRAAILRNVTDSYKHQQESRSYPKSSSHGYNVRQNEENTDWPKKAVANNSLSAVQRRRALAEQSRSRGNPMDDILENSTRYTVTTNRATTTSRQRVPPSQKSCSTIGVKPPVCGRRGQADYFDINLNTRVYSSLAILRSQIQADSHLGTPCKPLTETLMITRDKDNIGRWARITNPPAYFECVEADVNIHSYVSTASSFKRYVARMGLVAELQNVIANFDTLRSDCNSAMQKAYRHPKKVPVPDHWWPVGVDGSKTHHRTSIDPSCLRAQTPTEKTLSLSFVAKQIFKISDAAFERVLSKKTTLLCEVSATCQYWIAERKNIPMPSRIPVKFVPYTTQLSLKERFFEVKLGVYYILERGTVIKFLTQPSSFTDFVIETAIGFSVDRNIKGAVGVTATCPEGFCMEMDFAGVALQDVLNADFNCSLENPRYTGVGREIIQHHMAPSNAVGTLYGVRMLQATGCLPESVQAMCKQPITDSYSAIGVTNAMRDTLLQDLPFVIGELVNIVTRLSQQGLVNPDIKSDNIVIDGRTGQPKMIDFGLALPIGNRDTARSVSPNDVFSHYPQTAPEYLNGNRCEEGAMTYGLSYMITDILNTLITRTGNIAAACMSVNVPLSLFLARAYSADAKERPRAFLMSPIIGACFPFRKEIASLFANPKHTIIYK